MTVVSAFFSKRLAVIFCSKGRFGLTWRIWDKICSACNGRGGQESFDQELSSVPLIKLGSGGT